VQQPRLIAATFFGGHPLDYVPTLTLGADLTVLLGPNGAGKSTALRSLAANLLHPLDDPASVSGARDLNADLSLLFIELDFAALDTLLSAGLDRLNRGHTLTDDYPDGYPLAGWRRTTRARLPDGWSDQRPVDAWIRLLEDSILDESDAAHSVLTALSRSTVVAVESVHTDGSVRAYWCLRSGVEELPPHLADALQALGLRQGELDITDAMLATRAPAVAAPLGVIPSDVVPTIVSAPQGIDIALTVLRHSIATHIQAARRRVDANVPTILAEEPSPDPVDGPIWLEESEAGSFYLSDHASNSLIAAEHLVNRFLPPFVGKEFKVTLDITAVPYWTGGPELIAQIDLDRKPMGEPSAHTHPLNQAADGHKLWLELAVHETSRVLYVASRALDRATATAEHDNSFEDAATLLDPATFVLPDDEPSSDGGWEDLATWLEQQDTRSRVYVIDEPERHLHPVLERHAARWLMEFASRSGNQVVVATHSPMFLRLTGAVVWNFLDPGAGVPDPNVTDALPPTRISTFRPHEQDAFGALAETMGYDRGELLAGASLLLFVEGVSDMTVLHELFGAELHAAGVVVIPIHGAFRAEQKGVTDSEILMRFTAVRTGLLFDQLTSDEVRQLVTDAQFRMEALGSRSTELKAMARVIQNAVALEREIVPLSIPVHDVFDLLDEELIRERYPSFPGHRTAREIAADRGWKHLYKERFGIDLLEDELVFEEISRRMRETARVQHPALARLLHDILSAADR
jgi:energy-coupling factor transporter ATP-binding protein EcfA2